MVNIDHGNPDTKKESVYSILEQAGIPRLLTTGKSTIFNAQKVEKKQGINHFKLSVITCV